MEIIDIRKNVSKPDRIVFDDFDCLSFDDEGWIVVTRLHSLPESGPASTRRICDQDSIDDLIAALQKAKELWYE